MRAPHRVISPFSSANAAAREVAAGRVSAPELVEGAIARIEALDPLVNAVVVRDFDGARSAAARRQSEVDRGRRAPLLGVPITVKESFDVPGLPSTWGVAQLREWRPQKQTLALTRLLEAGAILLGKTNLAIGLADWQCVSEAYGRTNNPWNLTRTPGGSSGGSAAALAAGFSFLELGSDVAGSIRIPAAFCGVYGHRPTSDLVPLQGFGFLGNPYFSELTGLGPMARTARDLSTALDVLIGPEPPRSRAWGVSMPKARHEKLRDFRVFVLDRHPLVPTSRAVTDAVELVASELRRAGSTIGVRDARLPDIAKNTELFARLFAPAGLVRCSPQQYDAILEQARSLPADDRSLGATGMRACLGSHRDWLVAMEARARQHVRWQSFFERWDVMVCPVSPVPAFPHDGRPMYERVLDVDGVSIPYSDQIAWISWASLCGLPATTAPVTRSSDGLPIGVQIIGAPYDDYTTIAFAQQLEDRFGGVAEPPEFRSGLSAPSIAEA
jgi:amidase